MIQLLIFVQFILQYSLSIFLDILDRLFMQIFRIPVFSQIMGYMYIAVGLK